MRLGRIYFISDGRAIKIGFALDANKRLKALQVAHYIPLLLIGSCAGRQSKEFEFHERLKAHRILGEWFAIHADVFALINELETKRGWVEGDSEDDLAIKNHNAEMRRASYAGDSSYSRNR